MIARTVTCAGCGRPYAHAGFVGLPLVQRNEDSFLAIEVRACACGVPIGAPVGPSRRALDAMQEAWNATA